VGYIRVLWNKSCNSGILAYDIYCLKLHRNSAKNKPLMSKQMLIQDNLVLTRSDPSGMGGTQLIYRVKNYGLTAVNRPQEEISQIHWEVEVIKFKDDTISSFEACHTTELADKTLKFYTDKSLNEFIEKSFQYLEELGSLEKMLPQEP